MRTFKSDLLLADMNTDRGLRTFTSHVTPEAASSSWTEFVGTFKKEIHLGGVKPKDIARFNENVIKTLNLLQKFAKPVPDGTPLPAGADQISIPDMSNETRICMRPASESFAPAVLWACAGGMRLPPAEQATQQYRFIFLRASHLPAVVVDTQLVLPRALLKHLDDKKRAAAEAAAEFERL